jgi:cation transport ATPase
VNTIDSLLSRPLEQRAREYKYRFAQAVIFGLPVLALHWFGHMLGGPADEAQRWTAVLQALLAGWVTYVAAAGMLAEGVLSLSCKIGADLLVAVISVLLYIYSAVSVTGVFVGGRPLYGPLLFHVVVIVLALWCGARWWLLHNCRNKVSSTPSSP